VSTSSCFEGPGGVARVTDPGRGDQERDTLLALHKRLADGDPLASSEAAAMLLRPLVDEIQQKYPRLDEQMIADAVVDALLDYFADPSSAEKSGGVDPRGYLSRAAWRNAANLWRGSRRRGRREKEWATDLAVARVADDSVVGTLIQEEEKAHQERQLAKLMSLLPNESDQRVLRLRLQGERRMESFALALGIGHLSIEEQRSRVKRVKDRIDKVIKRAWNQEP